MSAKDSRPKPDTEYVIVHETIFQSWARDASTLALFGALIGILAESTAMQWAGFFVAIIASISRASAMKVKRMTRADAIAYLQSQEGA